MPEVELDEEIYNKIKAWISTHSIDMTVDEFVNDIIAMVFEQEDEWLSDF